MYISSRARSAGSRSASSRCARTPELSRRTTRSTSSSASPRPRTLERYLHTRYVGQKRFSLEGGETLIPVLDNLLQRAGAAGVQELVIGMAHRGRLNVLVNTLGKMPKDLFAEFEGKHDDDAARRATSSTTRASPRTSTRRAGRCT